MDRDAFVAAMIAELKCQKEASISDVDQSSRASRTAAALCFDMASVPDEDAGQLADVILAILAEFLKGKAIPGTTSLVLPPWLDLGPKFLAGVLCCADRASARVKDQSSSIDSGLLPTFVPSSAGISRLVAVVCLKLPAVLLRQAPTVDSRLSTLLEVNVSIDAMGGLAPEDWSRLDLTGDVLFAVSHLLASPSQLSRHWMKLVHILRDRALTSPAAAACDVALPLLSLVSPLPAGPQCAITTFVNRMVMASIMEVCESAAISGQQPVFRSRFLASVRPILATIQQTIDHAVTVLSTVTPPPAPGSDGIPHTDLLRDAARDLEITRRVLTVYLRWGSAVSASAVISQGILRSLVALVIAIPVTESVPPAVVTAVEIMHSIMCVNADASRFLSSVPSIRSWVLEEGFRAVGTSIFILWPCLFVAATSLPLTLSTALAPQETEVLVVGINRLKAVVEPFVSSFVALEALAPSHDAGGLATLKPALDTVQLCCSTLLQALQGIVYAMDQLCTRPQVVSALYSVLTPALAIVRRTFPIVPAPIHFPELAHTVKYSTGMCETTTPLAMGSVGDETAATASVEMGTSLEAADGPVSDSAESRRRDEDEMKARHVAKCCLDDFNSLRAQLKIIGQACSPDSARKAD